ncbi:MAG: DUF3352 domain-containing protein [Scytolyngbya sp. HA4215-MV1]|jgi:hypothetical protein|nr:DUF3352 domain-containing protein [Scytolyngbya sp. HA4215-MV1]
MSEKKNKPSETKNKPVVSYRKKKFPLLITLGTVSLLIGGGAAAYWYLTQGNFGASSLPVGANVIPQGALMTVALSTEPEQWQKLREFGTPETQVMLDKNLAQLRDRFLTANGFNYQQDIQPWVGKEVSLAFLAPAAKSAAPTEQNLPASVNSQSVMVVLPIQDPLKAKQLLEKTQASATNRLSDRIYKGYAIKESQGSAGGYAATVLDGKFLVVTTAPKAIEQAIDTYKDGNALTNTPGYAQAFGQIQVAQPFAKLYVNVPAAAAVATANTSPVPTQDFSQQQSQGVAATVTLASEGIQFKSVSWLKPNSERKYEVSNTARRMPDLLPEDTLMMASGGDLKRLWLDYTQGIAANARNFDPNELRKAIQSTIGMDLDRDFLEWMQGEYSLSMIPAPKNAPPSLPIGLMLMVQATNRQAADSSLSRLDEVMGSKYKLKVEAAKVGEQAVVQWTLPSGGLTVTRGWIGNDIAFITLGAPIASKVLPQPNPALSGNELFKKTTVSGLNPNNGNFFIDVDRAINANAFPLIPLPAGSQPLVKAIRSIGVTAAISSERSSRYDIFVLLKKGGTPQPLPSPSANDASPTPASPAPASPPVLEPSPTPSL